MLGQDGPHVIAPLPRRSHHVQVHVLAAPLQRDVVAHAPLVHNQLPQLLPPAGAGEAQCTALALTFAQASHGGLLPLLPSTHVMGLLGCSSRLSRSASSLLLSGPAHAQIGGGRP